MARNGSGTMSIPNTFVSGNTITASGHNQNFSDVSNEITNSVAADGQTSMTGPLKAANGSAAAPSVSFASDTDSGWYRKAANSIALALEGADKIVFTTAAASFAVTFIASATASFILTANFTVAPSVPAKSFAISKLADGTANRLYGTDGSGVATEITLGNGVSLSSSSLTATAQLPPGYLYGLTLSNGTDATNDINIASGKCRDSTDTVDIVIATALGKQLDANWAAGGTTGTPAGMRNSAVGIANGTYHLYAVRTAASSAGDVYAYAGVAGTDAMASATISAVLTALQAETGGASYAYARYIGSIVRTGGAIIAFVQTGDKVQLKTKARDINDTGDHSSATTGTLASVPVGVAVDAILTVAATNASGDHGTLVSSLSITAASPSITDTPSLTASIQTGGGRGVGHVEILTDISAQIRYQSTTTNVDTFIVTEGYFNRRGREA